MRTTKKPSIDPVVDASELAQILEVSLQTIYRWRFDGTLPPTILIGGKKRRLKWTRSSILAFLENRDSSTVLPDIESEAERDKRHKAAMRELQGLGAAMNTK